jgi:hypothetical protein
VTGEAPRYLAVNSPGEVHHGIGKGPA